MAGQAETSAHVPDRHRFTAISRRLDGGRGPHAMTDHPIIACYRGLDSADAVALGAQLARTLGEPLVLATAYRYEPAALSARPLPAPDNARRAAAAQTALRRARAFAGEDIDVREHVVAATGVPDALLALAREVDASALVVGRDVEGRVTRSLIPRAPCPVAVAPLSVPLSATEPVERIGVAFDGSDPARSALAVAARLAHTTGAQLVLLAVGETAEHAALWLHLARLSLPPDVKQASRALTGGTAAELTDASEDLDLLVCGSRGRGRARAKILGSVSTQLIATAHCPVLVVPCVVAPHSAGPLGVTSAAANS